jgi:hypothetical protein
MATGEGVGKGMEKRKRGGRKKEKKKRLSS